ncbi:uncharacterized protein N7515_008709 [Penicillium bovifimosum]|uniref:Alpha-galactosidase A n=1 Tax=Penicillium bovifimosum TaxID=126998 RepID=A0A9W9KWM4_9EURO|nr:uncharacterized protein N7515_008709 [Penicillium bovifimosum]KAJ5124884.1 hypothetical protein N7515_008709 [Penicillium bovifimosum]
MNNPIELLQAEADENDQSYFRLLVNGRIKYVTIDPGLYNVEDMCFGPSLISLLPLYQLANGILDCVQNVWHETSVEYTELEVGEKLRTGIYEVKCHLFNEPVVIKFARFDWEIQYLENETTAYQWIEGYEIGPRFLGHLREDGRVIGFLMERIKDARHAGPQDLEACRQVLARLHDLGIHHGDTNRFNFLVRGSMAVLIDFDSARKCDDRDALVREMELLPDSLGDLSRGGGGGLL